MIEKHFQCAIGNKFLKEIVTPPKEVSELSLEIYTRKKSKFRMKLYKWLKSKETVCTNSIVLFLYNYYRKRVSVNLTFWKTARYSLTGWTLILLTYTYRHPTPPSLVPSSPNHLSDMFLLSITGDFDYINPRG